MIPTMLPLSRWRASAAVETLHAWSADALHEQYLETVFRYVSRRLPVRAEAEDITAETFAAAFTALHTLRPDTDPLPWLLAIARRKIIDHARKRQRQPVVPLEAIELVEPGMDPQEQLLAAERKQELHALLNSLKPEQKRSSAASTLRGAQYRSDCRGDGKIYGWLLILFCSVPVRR
ncbi:MAG: sigma-70 family RNA polymerase sigma factor [Armatimonas sp.]